MNQMIQSRIRNYQSRNPGHMTVTYWAEQIEEYKMGAHVAYKIY
jgi:hypothetical protein